MKKLLTMLINAFVFLISLPVPKSSKIVLCGGWFGKRFADNSKAFFLYLSQNKQALGLKRVVYVTDNPDLCGLLTEHGYDVLMKKSWRSVWCHFRARYHIVDQGPMDVYKYFSIRARRVNLWHGFPLKRIGYLCKNTTQEIAGMTALFPQRARTSIGGWGCQYLLALSAEHRKWMEQAFAVPGNHVIEGIYPRIAYMKGEISPVLLPEELEAMDIVRQWKAQGRSIVFYLPTFRDSEEGNACLVQTINELQPFLQEQKIGLLTKLHFAADTGGATVKGSDEIVNLPPESDVYNFLAHADVLVTDYSSIYFDYLLLSRPIIFYCFDREVYETQDRGFLYDYDAFTPGEKAQTLQALESAVIRALQSPEDVMASYQEMYASVIASVYGDSTGTLQQLFETVKRL